MFTNDIVSEIKCIEKKGEFQFSRFVKERLIMGKVPITAKIQKNNISMLNNDLKTKETATIPSSVINKLKSAIALSTSRNIIIILNRMGSHIAWLKA